MKKVMRRRVIFMVTILMIAVSLSGCKVRITSRNGSNSDVELSIGGLTEYIVKQEEKVSAEEFSEIEKIYMNISVANVKVIREDREDCKVIFTGESKTDIEDSKHRLTLEVKENTVYIKTGPCNTKSENSSNYKLTVYIPEKYDSTIKLDVGVGNVRLSKMSLSKIEVTTGVGNIDLIDISGEVATETGVGNIEIDISNLKNKINISSGTGNVSLKLPKDSDFDLTAESGFGKISTAFSGDKNQSKISLTQKNGEGTYNINLESGVGDIKIKK